MRGAALALLLSANAAQAAVLRVLNLEFEIRSAQPVLGLLGRSETEKHVHVTPSSPYFPWYIAAIIILVLLGGVCAGLTIGLMGLDSVNLKVLSISGTPKERKDASIVLELLESGRHTMLVVLLLGNTVVNASLPIFLDSIVGGGWIAVLGSTFLIVIFGEYVFIARVERSLITHNRIIPQSVSNAYGLTIGATFAPLVRVLMMLMYPIAKPIAMVLDALLGTHQGVTYRKAELKTFVALAVNGEDRLSEEELKLIGSALEFAAKTVGDVMTPIEDVFTISAEKIMDDVIVQQIVRKGFSRIPVYEPSSPGTFIGVLPISSLIDYDTAERLPASAFARRVLPQTPPDLPLIDAMTYFQTGRSHIMLVTNNPGSPGGAIGVVTLEDVVEELISQEIIDETDQYIDSRSKIPVIRPTNRVLKSANLSKIFEGVIARRQAEDTLIANQSGRMYGHRRIESEQESLLAV